ncbi:MAG: class II aldolase/adducin family protein [Bacteroidota bacterium]
MPNALIAELNAARDQLYALQLIGAYPDGIGYGNISQRWKGDQFIISGSATGNDKKLDSTHYSLVTKVNVAQNQVWCRGPIKASSESMSHAMIYRECPEVTAVLHVHHLGYWQKWCYQIPTTPTEVAYGTPEMAQAILQLLRETSVRNHEQFFAMAGHREGLIGFGQNLSSALANTLKYCS